MYLENIRRNSPFLLDENGISVLSPFSYIPSTYLVKEAAVTAFRAFTAMDSNNQKQFFQLLAAEICRYAHHEYHWNWVECAGRIGLVLFPDGSCRCPDVYEDHR